jgi:hypothetical protein
MKDEWIELPAKSLPWRVRVRRRVFAVGRWLRHYGPWLLWLALVMPLVAVILAVSWIQHPLSLPEVVVDLLILGAVGIAFKFGLR